MIPRKVETFPEKKNETKKSRPLWDSELRSSTIKDWSQTAKNQIWSVNNFETFKKKTFKDTISMSFFALPLNIKIIIANSQLLKCQ